MIVMQDEELLATWLGEVPEDVRVECDLWTKWYHSAGAGGALGPLALIAMLRLLGYAPPKVEKTDAVIDWRQVPVPTPVDAKFGGVWMRGVYLGFVESGTLAVRLDGDDYVHECRKECVRMATDMMSVTPVEALEHVDIVGVVEPIDVEFSVSDTGEFRALPQNPQHETTSYVMPENPTEGVAYEVGSAVLVGDGEDVLDGVCVSLGDGTVMVQVAGEEGPREFASASVTAM
jgi:hypothetical protein